MTVRDWLQLLIVPFALVVISFLFTAQQDQRQQQIEQQRAEAERELEEQRAQDEALQAYLDQMSGLLLEKDLRSSDENSEVRTLARARTLTVLGRLDPSRKTQVMSFLVEAQLVRSVDQRDPVISLEEADLSGANLSGANLSGENLSEADLSEARLYGAELSNANLINANLSSANLLGADLSEADLLDANLSDANLYEAGLNLTDLSLADLSEANLSSADLIGADLGNANLSSANLSFADLSEATLIGTDLIGADLRGADLSEADLRLAVLGLANLRGADLRAADLRGADLREVLSVTKEQLDQAASHAGATMSDGAINSGRYATKKFEPALSLNVSDGWRLFPPEMTNELLIKGPDGGYLFFIRPLHVFDPSNPSERKEVPAPENADEWVSWFQKHPNLDASEPVRMSVGGASGVRVDVTAASIPENYPRDYCGARPCVPLFPDNVFYGEWKTRYVIVDVGGEPVVIDISAPADKFDEFLPLAQKVLDTVEWREGA